MLSADNVLEIPVTYKNQEYAFPAVFVSSGYTHKIQVEVEEHQILFEPDEEGNYRAMVNPAHLEKSGHLDIGLIEAISAVLNAVIK